MSDDLWIDQAEASRVADEMTYELPPINWMDLAAALKGLSEWLTRLQAQVDHLSARADIYLPRE